MGITLGGDLSEADFRKLEGSWITRELAGQAMLRRVESAEGATIIGRNGRGDYSGIVFPYVMPGAGEVREYFLRRDHPDYERDEAGKLKEQRKYLGPPGRTNLLYFVPGTPLQWLHDTRLPVAITEGAKKTLALHRLSLYESEVPRFLPTGLAGVWSWRGIIGKTGGPDGDRRNIKGPIPDLDLINWVERLALVVFDVNARTNESVAAARVSLSRELERRGAKVFWVEIPEVSGVNGIDDLLALGGPEAVLPLFFDDARPADTTRKFKNTDYGNAERLVTTRGDDILFCHVWKKWLHWDGTRWVIDESGEIVRLAKATVRSIYREAATIEDEGSRKATAKWAWESEKAPRIEAMIKLTQSEPDISVRPEQLDSDRWLMNCANGTIDLATGDLRPHRRDDLITKFAPVACDPLARCPRWKRFLQEVFEPHPDLIDFIQRAVGYSLTGDTREECLFLLWGTGRNGKGTLIKTLASMLGDYAGTADFSAFVQRRNNHGPRDDIAIMKGKRFISSQESREGAALAESLIKWVTGGDRVRARRLYENSYEWDPTHKIWLATNHKPVIRGADPAIWSRIKLIPFGISFEGREDKTLKLALLDELPGILAWAIEGCLEWQRQGLNFPPTIIEATGDYRHESDQIARFVEECCVVGEFAQVKARQLYKAYRDWAEEMGEQTLSETAFGLRITGRFRKDHKETGSVYLGVGLRAEQ